MTHKASRGLLEAVRAFKAPKRKPDEADRPPVQPLPGPNRKPLPGQIDLDGHETPGRNP